LSARLTRGSRPLPGFRLSLGYTVSYLGFLVLIPLAALAAHGLDLDAAGWARALFGERARAAYRVTFLCALAAASVNTVAGLAVAWLLARRSFPLKRLVDAAVDLPFALPAAVGGLALSSVYGPKGLIGEPALEWFGIRTAYSTVGVVLAMAFVSLPFAIRVVEPVLRDLDPEAEEAARTLGSGPFRLFFQVLLPPVFPALLTGFALCLARGIGEYGAVLFMSQNLPMVNEVASLLIVVRIEEPNLPAASGIALVLLAMSFLLLLAVNTLQARAQTWRSRP
jgi:sulfate transport system permease protein